MPTPTIYEQARREALLRQLRDSKPIDKMSHAELYAARGRTTDPAAQADLAPAEHAAFTREVTEANPLMALPLAVATPLYSAGKALGLTKARSPPSWAEVGAGWSGIGQGLVKAIRKARQKPTDDDGDRRSNASGGGGQYSLGGESD